MRRFKVLGWGAAALAGAALILGGAHLSVIAETVAGYKARISCSEIFVAGRDPASVEGDFDHVDPRFRRIRLSVDDDAETVRASLFGVVFATMKHRPGYGCARVGNAPEPVLPARPVIADEPWRLSDDAALRAEIDQILTRAVDDETGGHRAFLVVKDGRLIAEAYADGFDASTPMLSWSMAKSITAAMIGVAVREGLIDIDEAPPIPEWRKPGDARGAITWRHLLQMQSGLAFNEEGYADPASDINQTLYRAQSAADLGIRQPLTNQPGAIWRYASGSTNALQRALRLTLESVGRDYHRFAHEEIFEPLGAASAVFETDPAGEFVGSSFLYATARDWAKFGQLYLQNGEWAGRAILPAGWVDFVRAPAAQSDGRYGAHFWLNADGADGRRRYMPPLPETTFTMSGFEGQYVMIVPDAELIIVRLGRTPDLRNPGGPVNPVLAEIMAAIGE
ncbi:MAG: serine hydrolase [Pseudomonadota bacterium]